MTTPSRAERVAEIRKLIAEWADDQLDVSASVGAIGDLEARILAFLDGEMVGAYLARHSDIAEIERLEAALRERTAEMEELKGRLRVAVDKERAAEEALSSECLDRLDAESERDAALADVERLREALRQVVSGWPVPQALTIAYDALSTPTATR